MYDIDTERRILLLLGVVGTTNSIALVPTLVFLGENRLAEAIVAVVATANGWGTGAVWTQHRRLVLGLADASEAVRPVDQPRPERQAFLARLNERLSLYPNLWPSVVPIVVAMVALVGGVVVAVLQAVLG